jgi:IS30 family transposase
MITQTTPDPSGKPGELQRQLDAIAHSLNTRPRQTLGWMTPSQAFANALAMTA